MFTSLDSMGCNLITLQDLEWLDRRSGIGWGGKGNGMEGWEDVGFVGGFW